jgi:hypothetical protein
MELLMFCSTAWLLHSLFSLALVVLGRHLMGLEKKRSTSVLRVQRTVHARGGIMHVEARDDRHPRSQNSKSAKVS